MDDFAFRNVANEFTNEELLAVIRHLLKEIKRREELSKVLVEDINDDNWGGMVG